MVGGGGIHNVRGNLIALETLQIRGRDNITQVGMITKQFGGLIGEFLADSDSFTITFPLDLDVNMKAVAIGAAFLIVSYFIVVFANITIAGKPTDVLKQICL